MEIELKHIYKLQTQSKQKKNNIRRYIGKIHPADILGDITNTKQYEHKRYPSPSPYRHDFP